MYARHRISNRKKHSARILVTMVSIRRRTVTRLPLSIIINCDNRRYRRTLIIHATFGQKVSLKGT